MKSWSVFVLSALCASAALAEPPPAPSVAGQQATSALVDVRGKRFVRFAIDVRRPYDEDQAWQQDAVLGCAYPEDRRVFVRSGDAYVPAASLLGKDVEPEPSACRAAVVGA